MTESNKGLEAPFIRFGPLLDPDVCFFSNDRPPASGSPCLKASAWPCSSPCSSSPEDFSPSSTVVSPESTPLGHAQHANHGNKTDRPDAG